MNLVAVFWRALHLFNSPKKQIKIPLLCIVPIVYWPLSLRLILNQIGSAGIFEKMEDFFHSYVFFWIQTFFHSFGAVVGLANFKKSKPYNKSGTTLCFASLCFPLLSNFQVEKVSSKSQKLWKHPKTFCSLSFPLKNNLFQKHQRSCHKNVFIFESKYMYIFGAPFHPLSFLHLFNHNYALLNKKEQTDKKSNPQEYKEIKTHLIVHSIL